MPNQADVQKCRPVTRVIRRSEGGVQWLLRPRDAWGAAGAGKGEELGICLGGDLEGAGVPVASAAGSGMCRRPSVFISSSKWMVAMLGRSVYPNYYSKLCTKC